MNKINDYIENKEYKLFLNTCSLYFLFFCFFDCLKPMLTDAGIAKDIFLSGGSVLFFYLEVVLLPYTLLIIYKGHYESIGITMSLVMTYILGRWILYFQLASLSVDETLCLIIKCVLTGICVVCMLLNEKFDSDKKFCKIAGFTFAVLVAYLFNNKLPFPVLGIDLTVMPQWWLNLCIFFLSYFAVRGAQLYKAKK